MDLSWCLSCDRHCKGDDLYCSESCRLKDNQSISSPTLSSTSASPSSPLLNAFPSPGAPSSPLLEPFFSSFSHHDHRNSVFVTNSRSLSSTSFSLFPPISDT